MRVRTSLVHPLPRAMFGRDETAERRHPSPPPPPLKSTPNPPQAFQILKIQHSPLSPTLKTHRLVIRTRFASTRTVPPLIDPLVTRATTLLLTSMTKEDHSPGRTDPECSADGLPCNHSDLPGTVVSPGARKFNANTERFRFPSARPQCRMNELTTLNYVAKLTHTSITSDPQPQSRRLKPPSSSCRVPDR